MNDDLQAVSTGAASRPVTASLAPARRDGAGPRSTHHDARRAMNRKTFNKSRADLLVDLVRQLDLLIYAELSIIYYMDASFLLILARALQHFILLTPPPPDVPLPPFQPSRPFILLSVTGFALIALLSHACFAAPEASEVTRGYLHGGLVMDFVGQKGPSSRVVLVGLDLLVWALQVVMLEVDSVRKRAREAAGSMTVGHGAGIGAGGAHAGLVGLMGALGGGDTDTAATPARSDGGHDGAPGQTLDFEERGELAADFRPEDVELRELNREGISAGRGRRNRPRNREGDGDVAGGSVAGDVPAGPSDDMPARRDEHLFDVFGSGEIVVADVNPLRFVGRVWSELIKSYENPEPLAARQQRLLEAISWQRRFIREATGQGTR